MIVVCHADTLSALVDIASTLLLIFRLLPNLALFPSGSGAFFLTVRSFVLCYLALPGRAFVLLNCRAVDPSAPLRWLVAVPNRRSPI